MRFPAESLVPTGGEIYGHIFENRHTGLARNLFWSIWVEFEPMRYGDATFECSMTCEWIQWPVRHWIELDGRELDVEFGEDGVESSFYMTGHHVANHTMLALHHRREALFAASMRMSVDFRGHYGGDEDPALAVHAEVDLPFTGLIIMPENLFPKPSSLDEVRSVAAEFVDLSGFRDPERRDHGFILRPA
jgi:hypothetical protein